MKKIVFFIIFLFCIILNVQALEEQSHVQASLINCESATELWLKIGENSKRVKMIAFDVPSGELDSKINSDVCNLISSAKIIELEYDKTKTDKYNRELVWIFLDGELLQQKLISLGYGEVNNVTDDYNYLEVLCDVQMEAIKEKKGIWNYPNIKESYCKSGIKIENKKKEHKKVEKEYTSKVDKNLKYLLLLNAGLLLIILTMINRKK